MFLSDHEIEALCQGDSPLISPFVSTSVHTEGDERVISYGLSSVGYDMRLGHEFVRPTGNGVCDPKSPAPVRLGLLTMLEPGDYVLGVSLETFNFPPTLAAIVQGKSTLARSGLIVNMTPMEPGWTGRSTIILCNPTRHSIPLYPGEGIAQVMFFPCTPRVPYTARGGKYQGEMAPTAGKVLP